MIGNRFRILSGFAFGLFAVTPGIQSKDAGMFKFESSYKSVTALLDADTKTPLNADTFDEELWLLLNRKIDRPEDLKKYPDPVGIYFASRYVQWEVGNGGFTQAAENVPEWFEPAASGYQSLGKPKAAALIKKAISLLQTGDGESLEAQLEALVEEIPTDEWWIDPARVEYVRNHRDAFEVVR